MTYKYVITKICIRTNDCRLVHAITLKKMKIHSNIRILRGRLNIEKIVRISTTKYAEPRRKTEDTTYLLVIYVL